MTKSDCLSSADALEIILLHSSSVHSILNRKLITREILFQYLHNKQVAVRNDFTKQLLIEKTIQYWKENFQRAEAESESLTERSENVQECVEVEMSEYSGGEKVFDSDGTSEIDSPEHFPINQMSRKFASWFFTNLNDESLQRNDFWRDGKCSVQFLEQNVCMLEEEHFGDESIWTFCRELRQRYQLYFNLNETHNGVQGRIDRHGLVLVLSCGTLHKTDELVGTFECVFALSRDPYSENNWKTNRVNMRLHNFGTQAIAVMPDLSRCESIAPLLALDVPRTSIT